MVDTARLETSRTDTLKELLGYPVQNCPSGSFLFWGGPAGRGGVVYDIVWRRCPRRTPWMMLRTPVCSYPIIVTHLSFNFLWLLLLYSIYFNGADSSSHPTSCTWSNELKATIEKRIDQRAEGYSKIIDFYDMPMHLLSQKRSCHPLLWLGGQTAHQGQFSSLWILSGQYIQYIRHEI